MFTNISLHFSYDFSKRIVSSFLLKGNICSMDWIFILVSLLVVTLQSCMGMILFGLKSVPKKNPLWRSVLILLWRHEERKRERSPTRDNTLYQFPLSYVFSHQGYDRSRPPSTFDESFAFERNRDRYWRNHLYNCIQSMISGRSLQTCTEVI